MVKSPFSSLAVVLPASGLWIAFLVAPVTLSFVLRHTTENYTSNISIGLAISYFFIILPLIFCFLPIYVIFSIYRSKLFTNNRRKLYGVSFVIAIVLGTLLFAMGFGLFAICVPLYVTLSWLIFVEVLDGTIRSRWPEFAAVAKIEGS